MPKYRGVNYVNKKESKSKVVEMVYRGVSYLKRILGIGEPEPIQVKKEEDPKKLFLRNLSYAERFGSKT